MVTGGPQIQYSIALSYSHSQSRITTTLVNNNSPTVRTLWSGVAYTQPWKTITLGNNNLFTIQTWSGYIIKVHTQPSIIITMVTNNLSTIQTCWLAVTYMLIHQTNI